MITLEAMYDYVLRINTRIKTKTSPIAQRLEMVYDTGAGTTTISRQVALDAGYTIKNGDDYVDGLGGRMKADYTVIPDLIISGVSLGPVYTHVVDFHQKLAQRTSAILGMNVLSWFKITQDCHWNNGLERYDTATVLLEPKYDTSEFIKLENFLPFKKGQRFGTAFIIDKE